MIKIKRLSFLAIFLISILSPVTSAAETVYVKDVIRWSLRVEPARDSVSSRLIASGMKLEKLEERDNYTKIKTESGDIGWILTTNLVTKPTHNILYEREQKKTASLEKQIQRLKQNQELQTIEAELEKEYKNNVLLNQTLDQEKTKVIDLRSQLAALDPQQQNKKLILILIIGILLFILGFALGKYLIEQKLKAKFNGVKIW